jgi:hypothetical protein
MIYGQFITIRRPPTEVPRIGLLHVSFEESRVLLCISTLQVVLAKQVLVLTAFKRQEFSAD